MAPTKDPEKNREYVAAYRKRKKAKGKCQVCGQRKPAKNLTVCRPCNEAAKERVKASRDVEA